MSMFNNARGFNINGGAFNNVAGNQINGDYHNTNNGPYYNSPNYGNGTVNNGSNYNYMQNPPHRRGPMRGYPQRPPMPHVRSDPAKAYDDHEYYDNNDEDCSDEYEHSYRPPPIQRGNGRHYRDSRPAPPHRATDPQQQRPRPDRYAAQERTPKQQARGLRDPPEPRSRPQAPRAQYHGYDDGRGYAPRRQGQDYSGDEWDVHQRQPHRRAPPPHKPKYGSDYGSEEDHAYQPRGAPGGSRYMPEYGSDYDYEDDFQRTPPTPPPSGVPDAGSDDESDDGYESAVPSPSKEQGPKPEDKKDEQKADRSGSKA